MNKVLRAQNKLSTLRILGNGNSLNENIGNFELSEFDYLVVNRHVLSPSYSIIKPKYYVIADSHFFDNPEGLKIISKINEDTTWELILFIPFFRNKSSQLPHIVNNSKIKIEQYNFIDFKGFDFLKRFLYKKNLTMPKVQNVMVAAIYVGICGLYKRIELYGVEHSWTKYLTVNNNNEVCLENPHFFDNGNVKVQTWKEIQHEDAKFHEVLRMYANMFESYWELKSYAEKYKIDIYNFTMNSFIDAFQKEI